MELRELVVSPTNVSSEPLDDWPGSMPTPIHFAS